MRKINWGNILFSVVAMVVIISLMATTANAADVSGTYTHADLCTYSYTATSGQTGSVAVSGATFTLKAKGTNATTGCNSSPAVSCETILTITPSRDVKITATAGTGATVTANGINLGVETQVKGGTAVTFSITASNGTEVSNTLTVVLVADDTNNYPDDCATYYILDGDGKTYYYLDEAIAAIPNGGTVVANSTGTVYHSDHENGTATITIPNGVTFLLPRMPGETAITGEADTDLLKNANYDVWDKDSVSTMSTTDTKRQNVVLTIPAGTTLNNYGRIILGGSIASYSSYFSGGTQSQYNFYNRNTSASDTETAHKHSDMVLNGTINMGSNSVLSAIGFITGSTGTINANGTNADGTNVTGVKIYQPFVITDYRGGNYVAGAGGKYGSLDYTVDTGEESIISPFVRYTMQNIQVTINMKSGNYMYGYCDMWASSQHNLTTACIIGDKNKEGLIKLADGAEITAKYQNSNKVSHYDAFVDGNVNEGTRGGINGWGYNQIGRTKLTITGGASLGDMSLDVKINSSMTAEMHMKDVTFPLPYNYDIYLNAATGSTAAYSIPYSMQLLPGASITVGTGATLTIGDGSTTMRFMIMDGLFDHTRHGEVGSWSTPTVTSSYRYTTDFTYPKTGELQTAGLSGTAVLKLNGGKLVVNPNVMFGGLVQASGLSGEQIIFNGTSGCTTRIGLVGKNDLKFAVAGATDRTLPARLMNGAGEYVEMKTGGVYKSAADNDNTITAYSFNLYTTSSNTGTYTTYTETAGKVCDNCATCQLKYGSEKARCVCNIFSPIAVSGMWYDYTLTVKETGKADVVYYHLGGKLYTANGEVTSHTITDGFGAEVTSGGGVTVAASGTTLTFTEVNLTADTVVTVSASCEHTPGEAVYENFNTTDGTCDKVTICTKCGEELSRASEYVVRFSGLNVELNADIYLTYTLYILDKNATIVLTKPDPWDDTKTVTKKIPVADLIPDANGKYAVQMEIASGEMTREITIQVLDSEETPYQMFKNSNRSSLGDKAAFSVLSYAEIVLGKDENAEGLTESEKQSIIAKKNIVTALLTYGGYAQAYFDVDADNPAYNLLSEYSIDVPSLADIDADTVNGYVVTKGGNTELGITAKSYNPCLDYSVSFKLGFELNEGENIDSYTFMLKRPGTDEKEPLEAVYDESNNRYYVDVKAVPSGYLNDSYIVYVYKTGNDLPYTVEASILAWSRIILNRETAEVPDKNMAKALYIYSTAADDFFGK